MIFTDDPVADYERYSSDYEDMRDECEVCSECNLIITEGDYFILNKKGTVLWCRECYERKLEDVEDETIVCNMCNETAKTKYIKYGKKTYCRECFEEFNREYI